jgi:hypothetical protein
MVASGYRIHHRRSAVSISQDEVFGLKSRTARIDESIMSPSELTELLTRVNDRIKSAITGASSLVALAIVAAVGGYGVHRIQYGMAQLLTLFAMLGGVIMVAAFAYFRWQRDEIYDDIVLHGFRHVHPQAVARRAADLVSRGRREQVADTLDRFVEAAVEHRRTPVPVHRGALIELQPQVTQLSAILRAENVELEPAGMVLLQRFITDGAASPLFRTGTEPTEMERELNRIARTLGTDQLAA